MMIVRSFLLAFGLSTALMSYPALGAMDREQILQAATDFLTQHTAELASQYGDTNRVEFTLSPLDPRLSMADCPRPLSTELKSVNTVGRVNIKVSCQHTNRWSLYVPAEIKLYRSVVSVSSPVAKGELLSASRLLLHEMEVSKLSGTYFTRIEDVAGQQAKRPLRPNKPVIASHLEPPVIIKRGDAVLMTANSGGLMVKIPGIALKDGHKGEQISVRNSQSKRVVEARVTAPGQVSVAM